MTINYSYEYKFDCNTEKVQIFDIQQWIKQESNIQKPNYNCNVWLKSNEINKSKYENEARSMTEIWGIKSNINIKNKTQNTLNANTQ